MTAINSDQLPIKVATVGAGYFSQFHRDSWQRLPGVEPVGVCDPAQDRAQATGWPVFKTVPEMLVATQPDILDIIVPPSAQASVIYEALGADIRWIICQKPFCADLVEARDVAAKAGEADAALIVHENFRFQPWYREIKRLIRKGAIGELQQITFRLRPGDGQGPDAYMDRQPYFQTMKRFLVHETAVHWIDTFRFLIGEPTSVYADLRRLNPSVSGEDAGVILLEFEGGKRAIWDGNRHLDHAATNTRCTMGEAMFEGTGGVLSLWGDGSVTRRAFGALDNQTILRAQDWSGFGGDCVHALQSHVLSALRNGTPLENSAHDYLPVIEIEEAIYASAERGARVDL